jgi:hypothetical protein
MIGERHWQLHILCLHRLLLPLVRASPPFGFLRFDPFNQSAFGP